MSHAATLTEPKPLLRGASHLVAFFVSPLVGLGLYSVAPQRAGVLAAAVYTASLAAMFGASALLHRTNVRPGVQRWLERLDYSTIFVFIAGTYTPFALLLGEGGQVLLPLVWGAAALGIARSLFWVDAPHWVAVALYLLAGWLAVPFAVPLWRAIGTQGLAWLVAGGLLYTAGAVVFALKRPNPAPGVFGFHEVFHLLVILACACHLVPVAAAVARLQ